MPLIRSAASLTPLRALLCASLCAVAARAETVALWLFDEAPADAELVPGKFGHAFRPAARATTLPAPPRLALDARDWTLECWLLLDPEASDEGVLLELSAGGDLATRFSVLPRENAFALDGPSADIATGGASLARRIEFTNPEGPPGGSLILRTTMLALAAPPIPRGVWCHIALVHTSATGELRLFLDGRSRAVATARPAALPPGPTRVALGRDGSGGRRLAGALDELRVSDRAIYATEFTPPSTFAAAPRKESP